MEGSNSAFRIPNSELFKVCSFSLFAAVRFNMLYVAILGMTIGLGIRWQISDNRWQMSDFRCQMTDVRCIKSTLCSLYSAVLLV